MMPGWPRAAIVAWRFMTGKYRLRAAMLDNWLFAARHDWRCWQGQRFKYLVLIAGFALVCGLLALSLRLGQLLLHEPPAWAAADQHYLTLVQEDKSGRLVGRSSLAEIESLRERPQVHAAAALRFDALDVEHARSEEHTSELQSRGHLVCR